MGLLDYDLELAKQAIKRFPGLLNEYAGTINRNLRDKFASDEFDQKRATHGLDAMAGGDLKQSRQQLDEAIAKKMVNVGLDLNPGAIGKIVWHGSPHKFNQFDMSKIGTGEGAQAYGHGLYMAENKKVAQDYAAMNPAVTPSPNRLWNGKELIPGSPEYHAATLLESRSLPQTRKEVAAWIKEAETWPDVRKNAPSEQATIAGWQKTLDFLNSVQKKSEFKVGKNDTLYKVDIPDEAVARFLDWDKPLSQQAPEVRAAIGKMRDQFPISKNGWDIKPWMDADPLASTWHNEAVRELGLGQDYFTKHLSENGVPGIRYLDGGSRGTGQGTSNYVLFDDQMPRILEVNGQPTGLNPWNPGEWAGLLGK